MDCLRPVVILCLNILLNFSAGAATTYYVATNGVNGNTGLTSGSPWPMSKGLLYLTNGNTVLALPGSYDPGSYYDIANITNSSANRATLRSSQKWGAIIEQANFYGIGFTFAYGIDLDGFVIRSNTTYGIIGAGGDIGIKNCIVEWNQLDGIAMNSGGSYMFSNIVENCLVRFNGALTNTSGIYGHGLYINGWDNIVRNNYFLSNWGAHIHHYSGDAGTKMYGNKFYGNFAVGHPAGSVGTKSYQRGLVLYNSMYDGTLPGTNYVFNNTFLSGMSSSGGAHAATNNILLGGNHDGVVLYTNSGALAVANYNDYNFSTNTISGSGENNVISANTPISTLFPGHASGRFWLPANSPGRAVAFKSMAVPVSFYGIQNVSPNDIGYMPFSAMHTSDDINYTSEAFDPWLAPPDRIDVNAGPGQHLITWSGPQYPGTYYWVYRKTGAGAWGFLATVDSGNMDFYSHATAGLTHGETYSYRVATVAPSGLYRGPYSRVVSIVCDKTSISHSSQRVPWGSFYQGVPGGIPSGYTVFCNAASSIPGTNIVAAADGSDATPAIEAALKLAAASGSNLVVTLPAGTFTLKQGLSFGGKSGFAKANNIILRGAGTNATILQAAFTNLTGNIINFGGYSESGTERILNADLPIGGTTLTLANVSGITAGTLIKVWQDKADDNEGAFADGSDDPVHYSSNGSSKGAAGAPLVRQMFMVTGVSGNDLTIDQPSVFLFRAEDATCRNFQTYETRYSGIEDLTIRNLSGAQGTNIDKIIYMSQTAYCWLKNVLTENADFAHVYVDYSLRPEFCKSRHVGAPVFGPSAGVGYEFYSHVTGPKIEYCIWDQSFPAVECGLGVSSGYIYGSYAVNSKGGTPAFDLAHGAHNAGWLVDNCYANGVLFGDGYFGSADRMLVHRSILTGEPADGGFRRVVDACHFVRNVGVINSRLGWTNDSAPLEYESYVNGWTGGRKSIYRLGYPNLGNTTYTGTNTSRQATTFAALDFWVKTNMVRHLNWDSATAGVVSDAGIAAVTSPYSYVSDYDSIFPEDDWTGAPWPAVGVDSGHTWDGANPSYAYYHQGSAPPPPEPAPPGRFGGGGQFVF